MLIFINGYWNRITNILGLSPGTPDEAYWNYFSPHFISKSREFMNVSADETNYFVDGSSLFVIDQFAKDRYESGYKHAEKNFNLLVDKLKKRETFKIISHSEGGAFAAGMANFLISKSCNIDMMLYLSPREGDDINNPLDVFAVQAHFVNDPVCLPKRINGVGVYILLQRLDGKKASLPLAHGGTVKTSTIRKVKRLLALLHHTGKNKLIEEQWTIIEKEKGFEFKQEKDLTSEK